MAVRVGRFGGTAPKRGCKKKTNCAETASESAQRASEAVAQFVFFFASLFRGCLVPRCILGRELGWGCVCVRCA